VLVDSSILAYALGGPDPRREPCRRLMQELAAGGGRAYASTEMFQELIYHRMRRGTREAAVAAVRKAQPHFITLNFDHEVLELALELIERTDIRGRDAVHAATALAYGIEKIASSDPAFDDIPGLTRIDPLAA
jgi:predicted nucleic acid-binding protein